MPGLTRTTRRMAGRVGGAAVAALVLAACQPRPLPQLPLGDNAGTLDAASVGLPCSQAADHLLLTTSTHLDPACTWTGGIEITASGVTLDCRGATIDAGAGRSGVGIRVHADASVALADVTVRNCVVHGFLNGVRVSRDGVKSLPHGSEYNVNDSAITLDNNHISDTGGVGVYVDAYVSGVTIDHLDVADAGSTGIYLEAGSKGSVVQHSFVHANGFAGTQPPGQTITVGGVTFRYLTSGREGIAVDGSTDNVIRDNVVLGNAGGGIFLYKNCGEYATQKPAQWWPRYAGADRNLIEDNVIAQERSGVWIGSRMAENTYFLDCSDPTYLSGSVTAVRLDHAADDTVQGNTFVDVSHGVRVEDDGATVVGNRFAGDAASPSFPAAEAVLIGTRHRTEVLGEPVAGTVLAHNRAELTGVTKPFGWVHGEVATTDDDNTSFGAPSQLGAGVQPPIDPFLFVASISLA